MNDFWQKIGAIQAKVNQTNSICTQFLHNAFFWIFILIDLEMNIIDYQFNSTSLWLFFIEKDIMNKTKHISHVDYIY